MKNLKSPLLKTFLLPILLGAFLSASGCSSHSIKPDRPSEEVATAQATQVEISYSLGHNQHRFTAQGSLQKAEVTTYFEQDIVEQANVDSSKYLSFVSKAVAFAQKPHRTPAQTEECRSPFKVTVKIDEKTYTSDGCRFNDEGSLSRLVRDGEFLLYSKN